MFCSYHILLSGQSQPAQDIEDIIRQKQASTGVAVLYGDQAIIIGNEQQYPIMSVFKLHVAITALKKMEAEQIALDSMTHIEPEQMHKNTYSPLRDKYPDQRISISYKDIIEYTVTHSDNNACDWLIGFAGGIREVDAYIKSLGIKDFNLSRTESDMHADLANCYDNWSSPLAIVQLLKKIYTENILSQEHFSFLEETMLNCSTGKDKLKAGLPAGIMLAHKTGHSDRTPNGLQIGNADVGVIYMPQGERCYIAVLIKDSAETDKENARIIAEIAKIAYGCLQKGHPAGK